MTQQRILIVGGVAGGASCAARSRRLSETAEIIMFDRGQYVSFANCGLPYYVGDVITDEAKLLVADSDLFKERFNIEVRLRSEVIAINREQRRIKVRALDTGEVYEEAYDALVLAPGASPIRPPLPGIDLPGIFALRTIPDSRYIRQWITDHRVSQAVVVGGGFIGLEMTENLVRRGIQVTVIEMMDQIMAPLDREMVSRVEERMRSHGVTLVLGDGVAGFAAVSDRLQVTTRSGQLYPADIVILGIGVRPETTLAQQAGLVLGDRGGIRVDAQMRTSDPHIWAVGDVVEVKDVVTQEWMLIPLAGPANRQGRVAADAIANRQTTFRGVQGTSVCGIFDLTVAATGANEKTLRRLGQPYQKIYLHPGHHVGYFPGAKPIDIKLLFTPDTGHILGAQAIGEEGVEKRIDVIAMTLQQQGTVFDLEEAELCYAPQFGAAKDPVNFAGMIAANALRGDAPVAQWDHTDWQQGQLLDVREPGEFSQGHVPGARNMPLSQLRDRLTDLSSDRPIYVYCEVGQRAYYATRALRLNGFNAFNLTGGYKTYRSLATKNT
jgi:NADPH-dependent 2,4-dienoyl-CoA reductase/sulfur reductase-like enzyme/rhodanese-related sulfurtransferase